MTVNSNLETFCNKQVTNYIPKKGIKNPETLAYRLIISYEEYETGIEMETMIEKFVKDPLASTVEDLIIGAYDYESSTSSSGLVGSLVKAKNKLPKLKNLFIGDITYEEAEISWIQQSDVNSMFSAFPNLEHFQIRGGTGLSLGKIVHKNLKTLIVETGGLPPNVIEEINDSDLPNLTHLELWLGSSEYGFESTVEDLDAILSGQKFPKLKYLGLKDSDIADEIAIALQGAVVLQGLDELNLSMGTLGDVGAQALINNADLRNVGHINLSHHYMSTEMMHKISNEFISVNVDNQLEADEDGDRYVEVAE